MNYGEIKHNIISFGFADQSDYDEYEALGYTYDAINQAIMQLNEQFPYIDTFEFEIDETDEGPYEIDMGARDGFLELAKDTPVVIEVNGKDVFKPFGAYEVKKDRILHINADENKGTFRVYYNRACTTINAETADTFTPELPLKAHRLIPYLASYLLWQDDDPTKAAQYYNSYEIGKNEIVQKENAPRMRVNTDWRGI